MRKVVSLIAVCVLIIFNVGCSSEIGKGDQVYFEIPADRFVNTGWAQGKVHSIEGDDAIVAITSRQLFRGSPSPLKLSVMRDPVISIKKDLLYSLSEGEDRIEARVNLQKAVAQKPNPQELESIIRETFEILGSPELGAMADLTGLAVKYGKDFDNAKNQSQLEDARQWIPRIKDILIDHGYYNEFIISGPVSKRSDNMVFKTAKAHLVQLHRSGLELIRKASSIEEAVKLKSIFLDLRERGYNMYSNDGKHEPTPGLTEQVDRKNIIKLVNGTIIASQLLHSSEAYPTEKAAIDAYQQYNKKVTSLKKNLGAEIKLTVVTKEAFLKPTMDNLKKMAVRDKLSN